MPRLNVAKMLHIMRLEKHRFINRCVNRVLVQIMPVFLTLETQQFRLARLQSKPTLRLIIAVLALFLCLRPDTSTAQANKYAAIVIEEASGKVLF